MRHQPLGASVTELRTASEADAAVTSLDHLPLMLTIDEAAQVLRIGRTTAYKLVELHRTSRGRMGLPHVRLGSRLLVRRVDLATIVGLPRAVDVEGRSPAR